MNYPLSCATFLAAKSATAAWLQFAFCRPRFALVVILAFVSSPGFCTSHGATIEYITTGNQNLNLSSNWSGGTLPGSNDIALWDAGSPSGTALLGAPTTWLGLKFGSVATGNPAGPVTLGADGNTLTLGTGGIDMSAATQSLTIEANLTIAPGGQTWNVGSSQTLTLASTGTFTRSAGSTLVIAGGSGVLATSMINFAVNTNGIVGPWAIISTPGAAANSSFGGYVYATNIGDIVPYTSATPETAFGWPTGNAATVNYDVSGVQGGLGVSRTANVVRYTGTTGFKTGASRTPPL